MAATGRTIVVGVDGSNNADKAFNWTLENLIRKNDNVVVVHSPEITIPFSMQDSVTIAQAVADKHKEVDHLVAKYAEVLKKKGIPGKAVRADGHKAGEAIVASASEHNANMIVTGTRGLGTIRKTLLGSVSEYILQHAHVPVTVYKESSN